MKKRVLVRPGLHRYEELFPQWLWVSLKDLAECVNRSPNDLWENYYDFYWPARSFGGAEICSPPAWCLDDAPEMEVKLGGTPPFDQSVMVSAGYANNVQRAHQLGIVRVTMAYHPLAHHNHLVYSAWDGCHGKSLMSYRQGHMKEYYCVLGYNADGKQVHLESHHAWGKVPVTPDDQTKPPRIHVSVC